MKTKSTLIGLLIVIVLLLVTPIAPSAQTVNDTISSGTAWLLNARYDQNMWAFKTPPDPEQTEFTVDDFTRTYLRDTFAATLTLQALQVDALGYASTIDWIEYALPQSTEFIAQKLLTLNKSRRDVSEPLSLILANRKSDGGFAGAKKYPSNNLDTAFALQALKSVNYFDQTVINSAINYILSAQNVDGGWGVCSLTTSGCGDGGADSNVYMTALVSSTLQQTQSAEALKSKSAIATAVNKATAYLIANQNADGGFGAGASTVFETAYAYMALVGITTDNTVLGNAINYLTSTQLTNGSWNDDPYSTALALRALHISENMPLPPPSPTTGTITGKVVNASTNQPLNNVSVSAISNQPVTATQTDATGGFTLPNLSTGSQSMTFSLAGYAPATVTVNVTAGSIINIGPISLSPNPTSGILRGTVTDAADSQPLSGAAITVTGSVTGSSITGADGSFIFSNVTPGAVTITASMAGYYPVSGTGTVAAGGVLFFNPQLSTTPPQATTGNLTGKVFDSATNIPVQGAIVSVSGGPTASTDVQGGFLIADLTPASYQVTVSATGHQPQTYQILITAGVTSNMQTIYLSPSLQSTIISGNITDASTGSPLYGAAVTISGTAFSAKTSADGSYTMTGIDLLEFTVKAAAAGYNSKTTTTVTSAYGTYIVDFTLDKSAASDIEIVSVTTEAQSYSINNNVTITGTIQNNGETEISGLVAAEIQDSMGNIIAQVSPDGPNITIASFGNIQTVMNWNTGQFPPGNYNIVLKVTAPPSSDYPVISGELFAELSTVITITEAKALIGALSLTPPVTQADMQLPVTIKTAIRNAGNVPITTSLNIEAALDGVTVYSANSEVTGLQVNGVMEIVLGSFTPSQGGDYSIRIKPVDPAIASNILTVLYVGPHATAAFTVSPTEAVAGDARVIAKISLTGIGATTGTTEDPLVPLIKDAIQKGVIWEQVNAVNWQIGRNCYGCHVQTQTLIGLELSRDKVLVDDSKASKLLTFMMSCQGTNGSMGHYPGGWSPYNEFLEATTLYAWSLSYYHDTEQVQSALIKGLDFIITRQNASGHWISDNCFGVMDLWNDLGCNQPSTPFTAYNIVSLAKGYQLAGLQKYKDAALKAVDHLMLTDHTKSIVTAAHIAIGLQGARSLIDDENTKNVVAEKMNNAISYLRQKQNSDGGWGKYAGNTSDPLPTAHVLYAMSLSGVDSADITLRKGAAYLIGKQNADGTWTTPFIRASTYPDRHFGVTTWAIISLPATLETISGQAADLKVTLPQNITLNSSSMAPSSLSALGDNTEYLWSFKGLTADSTDLLLNLTLNNLQLGEQRKIAADAQISFKDTYTGNTFTLPLEIPYVSGIAPISVDVATDKTEYVANEDMLISVTAGNVSPDMRNPIVLLTVEDMGGNIIEDFGEVINDILSPVHNPPFMDGWHNRVKLIADHTKIPSDLSDFPLRIHLGSSSGISKADVTDIFNTLGDNRRKIAMTTSDGQTQCYVEIEKWDAAGKEAELWVRIPSVSAINDTVLYLYYDSAQPDNNSYVGDAGASAASNVWGNHYKAVYHMSQAPTGPQIPDSASYNNGIAYGAMTSGDLIAGPVAGGIKFDGVNDYVNIGKPVPENLRIPKALTLEAWIKPAAYFNAAGDIVGGIVSSQYDPDHTGYSLMMEYRAAAHGGVRGGIHFQIGSSQGYWTTASQGTTGVTMPIGSWTHVVAVAEENAQYKVYFNGELVADWTPKSGPITYGSNNRLSIGWNEHSLGSNRFFNGSIDEVRISDSARSAGWIKAAYLGNTDNLVLFGEREYVDDAHPASAKTVTVTWNPGSTMSGDYLVRAKLYENGEFLTEDTAQFNILPDKTLSSSVMVDKISYSPNQPVTITSTITSLSANYIFEDLTATITITDWAYGGTPLHPETQIVPILLPGQLVEFKTYWNTGTYPSGDYPVTLTITDASGAVLSTSTTTLTISSEVKPSKLLKGTISVDRQSLLQGESVAISYSVMNIGNMDLSQVELSVKTVHTVQLTVYDTLTEQTDLLKGGSYSNSRQLNTQNYSAKDYLVILTASISGVEETLASTYFRVEGAPSAPSLYSPAQGADVETLTPVLIVNNAADPNDDKLTYEFELYTDIGLSNLIASSGAIEEGTNTTSWQVLATLQENATYYWRDRAYDGRLYGEWMAPAAFRVNTLNEPPTAPGVSFPADSSNVDTTTPVLAVNNSTDPDSQNLTYNFVIAQDADLVNIVASQIGIFEGTGTTAWQVPTPLQENTWYYWGSQADDWLITGPWMTTAKFFLNTTNEAPSAPVIIAPAEGTETAVTDVGITALNSADPDSTYVFEVDSALTFDSPDKTTSESLPEGTGTTSWLAAGLRDNTWYYARAKASDGLAESLWSKVARFFVNTTNDAPTAPVLENPSNGSGVNVFNPLLSVHNSADPDGDVLTYEFEVYADAPLSNLLSAASYIEESTQTTPWTVTTTLTENTTYFWRARAFDSQLYSSWMPAASFMVNTANDAPDAPTLYAPSMGSSLSTLTPTLSFFNATDPDSDTLTYDYEVYAQGLLITTVTGVQQDISGLTSTVMNTLADNTTYNWRARAYDGDRYGAWMDMAVFSIHMPRTNINSTMDFDPNTLNLKNKGNWVTVYIELPTGYNVSDIAIDSVRLEGTIPAETWPYSIGDYDKDGVTELMVKFNRDAVINLLPNGDVVKVKVTGAVGAITFEGVDTIRVIK